MSETAPPSAEDPDTRLGARIHALRAARGLTLEALAGRAAVSRAMLSRIERGESSPTAQLLGRLCGGLGITLSALFAAAEAAAGPVVRRADQPVWDDPESRYRRRQVSPAGSGSPVEIVEVEFPAHGRVAFDRQELPGTDQHIWVLEGRLELTLGEEAIRLEQGDCLRMRFGRPILFRNPEDRPIRYAVILGHGAAP
ncbi:helix-turn-helix domain-containing protein [Paeniroseomonas aquatica]|uniref:XRE family transcriptional regulator n=1 Tax=Paeniroseomonas aquatica TaxID=373043 RepID=A0ABT8AHT3_9PROT|nr:XRE family transcriptional regulator [Paeniroseomonas aquatica]MDN3568934.1 XRE family transcriptional regulator [Paeniroseomonas aquatica]